MTTTTTTTLPCPTMIEGVVGSNGNVRSFKLSLVLCCL